MWRKTAIPIIQQRAVKEKMAKLMNAYTKTKQKIHVHKCSSNDLAYLHELFIISSCKCFVNDFTVGTCCNCLPPNRISENRLLFLIDQKTERKFSLDSYNFEMEVNEHRQPLPCSSLMKEADEKCFSATSTPSAASDTDDGEKENNDPDYFPDKFSSVPHRIILPNSLKELNFDSVFSEAVRFDTGYREVAAIINRTLEVVGAVTNQDKGLVVNKSFIQRGIKRIGKNMSRKWSEENSKNVLQCFFFDGVKTKNRMMVNKNGVILPDNSVVYENIVLVQQPADRYLGFVTTKICTAQVIFGKMQEFFVDNSISLESLIAIGCDGASTNTGVDNGIITKFENYLNRSLHWIVCILHLIDLILRAVATFYYGDTIGPGKYFGKINEDLSNCHTFDIVKFTKVALNNMPHSVESFDKSSLNTDQKYLYEISKAVSTGNLTEHLMNCKPGDLYDPRWTTLASRVLRLYASTETPSLKLIGLVHFIQNVYVPCFFWIKCYPNWTDGARNLFRILSFSRVLPKGVFNIVKERVVWNSYFAHPENVLMSMITDSDSAIRHEGYKLILNTRSNNCMRELVQNVRAFKKPDRLDVHHPEDINQYKYSDVNHYSKMINLNDNSIEITEPPFTSQYTEKQLKYFMDSKDQIIDVPRIPAHSQATELCVQVVKNVVQKYPGKETQDERVKTKIFARSLNPQFKSKSEKKIDYQCYDESK